MNNVNAGTQGAGTDGAVGLGRALPVIAIVLAGALQLLVGWFTLATGLVAPLWAIIVFGLLWVAGGVVLFNAARRKPVAAPLVPVVNGLLLWAGLAAGGAWLGWTP